MTIEARYSPGEEIANSLTHGIGILLSIGGLGVLTAFASVFGNARHIVGVSIFGFTMVLLYTSSTLYHSIPIPRVKSILRLIDHSAIFLLIAGTYTPFTLITLQGPWGWTLFGIVWTVAAAGIIFQTNLIQRFPIISVVLYILMGWVVVVAIKPLMERIAPGGLALLFGGGVSYTFGVLFYAWRNLPYHHAVWHLFVLGGTVLHYFAVLLFVIPVS